MGRFIGLSLRVKDIGTAYRDMMARGVHFPDPPEQQPWSGKLARVTDPDRNMHTLPG